MVVQRWAARALLQGRAAPEFGLEPVEKEKRLGWSNSSQLVTWGKVCTVSVQAQDGAPFVFLGGDVLHAELDKRALPGDGSLFLRALQPLPQPFPLHIPCLPVLL